MIKWGAILDTAIGAALGGIAAGGVHAALKQLSKKAARRVIRQALIRKFGRLGAITSGAIDLAMNYSSPGHWLAKYWDKHDKYPNNGRINF